jgi:SAM-dependent methyltransferase
MDYVISPSGQFNRSGGSIRKTMKKPAFYHWIDQEQAARKQHVEIARITGIGTGRMLDIGAGDGTYLGYFQQQGWECLGIETDEHLIRKSFQEHEVLMLQGHPAELGLPRNSYDIVRIRGILSTDDNPLQILKIAYEAVTPTGYIIAETWNKKGGIINPEPKETEPRFDKNTLTELFRQAGFDIGGIIAPAVGDEIWCPWKKNQHKLSFPARFINTISGLIDRGPLLVIFAQRPPEHSQEKF